MSSQGFCRIGSAYTSNIRCQSKNASMSHVVHNGVVIFQQELYYGVGGTPKVVQKGVAIFSTDTALWCL